jgi:hypothetical protein
MSPTERQNADAVAAHAMEANERMGAALAFLQRRYPLIWVEVMDYVTAQYGRQSDGSACDTEHT